MAAKKEKLFVTFGEFNSCVELNQAAEGLKNEGDIENLRVLADENGIDREDVEDYIAGAIPELTTTLTAALGKIAVERRELQKKSIVERMAGEVISNQLCTMLYDKKMAVAVRKKGKRFFAVYQTMKDVAENHKSGNVGIACGTDYDLQKILEAYYLHNAAKKQIESLYKDGASE